MMDLKQLDAKVRSMLFEGQDDARVWLYVNGQQYPVTSLSTYSNTEGVALVLLSDTEASTHA